jgi:hypothetical protein
VTLYLPQGVVGAFDEIRRRRRERKLGRTAPGSAA